MATFYPSFYGLSFIEEYNHLDSLRNPSRPFTLILGGAKEDKLKHLDKLISHCDHHFNWWQITSVFIPR